MTSWTIRRHCLLAGSLCLLLTESVVRAGGSLDCWMIAAEPTAAQGVTAPAEPPTAGLDGGKLRLADCVVSHPALSFHAPPGTQGPFFLGALTGLLGHETGHYLTNLLVGSTPRAESVHYGALPFFTWEPDHLLTDREHYLTASAGFNAQNLLNEFLLRKHATRARRSAGVAGADDLRLEGMLAFNYWLTVGYGANAFFGGGPPRRDTKGMADTARLPEAVIGALILTPALLDAYRYHHPEARWPRRASRTAKVLLLVLALRAPP